MEGSLASCTHPQHLLPVMVDVIHPAGTWLSLVAHFISFSPTQLLYHEHLSATCVIRATRMAVSLCSVVFYSSFKLTNMSHSLSSHLLLSTVHVCTYFRCGPECVFMPTTCDCLLFTLPGTCINNTGVFMFKKGCFELGATIYPAVIKVSGIWRRFPMPCRSLVNHLLPTFHSQAVHCWTSPPSPHLVHNIALMNMCAMQVMLGAAGCFR